MAAGDGRSCCFLELTLALRVHRKRVVNLISATLGQPALRRNQDDPDLRQKTTRTLGGLILVPLVAIALASASHGTLIRCTIVHASPSEN